MLKVRLQGTKQDIKWFSKFLNKTKVIKVLQISDAFENKGTSNYYRVYAEIEKNDECDQVDKTDESERCGGENNV